MEAVTSLAKRRGIAFQSSEIYGGLRSSWDYGPLGTEIKRNVREQWWRSTVQLRDDVVGLEAAVIMSPKVWEASGHLEVFTDPLVECLNCHQRFRADHLPGPPRVPELRADGLHPAEELPSDVQDEHGSDRGRGEHRLPASRDRAGDVRRLRHDPAGEPEEDPVRDRADRPVVPQRDHAGELHLPPAGVRADGDGVLRRAGHRRGLARVLDRGADAAGGPTSDSARTISGSASTTPTSSPTTRSAPSTSSTGSRSPTGASSRASRTGPTST